jgi:hypothetical protein
MKAQTERRQGRDRNMKGREKEGSTQINKERGRKMEA